MEDKILRKKYRPLAAEPLFSPKTDPQGSYTGVPADAEETPVQDADDL